MPIDTWRDKALFTPGPLTTSRTVKQAMLRDLGSRDEAFIAVVADIRRRLLALGGATEGEYTAIPMQGSGTFGIEAVLGSVIPPDDKLLVLVNGAYGRRMMQMAHVLCIACAELATPEHVRPAPQDVDDLLAADPAISHVAVVHCETTTGLINPVQEIAAVVKGRGRGLIVDAMSSFGAVPVDMPGWGIDYLISSANKCIEGVPGFAFVLARVADLLGTRGYARSLSLDLLAQWEGLEASGQFRFTPPTHALLAFHQALLELEAEGGVAGRSARYRANAALLQAGMAELGVRTYLAPADQSYIITSYRYPQHAGFDFGGFYRRLSERGCVIYPGKLSQADCFRIGTIGRLDPSDIRQLLAAIRETLQEMDLPVPIE